MKAMILAAGYGTRLRPLTRHRPKALVPVGNRPAIEHVIAYLKRFGIRDMVINAHHHAAQLVNHLNRGKPFGVRIQVKVEPEILGTGGGIGNTAGFWDDDPFLVINSDVLTNIDLEAALHFHTDHQALATLILHDAPPYNQIQVDDYLNVKDISERPQPGRLAFTGLHIISPSLLSHIPIGISSNIIDCYRERIQAGEPIKGYITHGHHWLDMGTLESYVRANREAPGSHPALIGPGCRIHPGAVFEDWVVIGPNTTIEEAVEIKRSILWENVHVRAGSRVLDSIVTASQDVRKDLVGEIQGGRPLPRASSLM